MNISYRHDFIFLAGSYPLDYDFKGLPHKYLIRISVTPIITAKIASRIYKQ